MNWHEILGVTQNATIAEIKSAYRKKCLEYHPDKCRLPNAAQKFIEANNAYRALTDPTYKPSAPPAPRPQPKPQVRPQPRPQPRYNIWGREETNEQKVNDSLWARFQNDFYKPAEYRPSIPIPKPPEIDLWAQTVTESENFTKDYWKKYKELKSSLAYEEPDKFWDALDEWTSERRKKKSQ
jgi:curved DNA-binding protein CbpA